jgi:NADPH-ferrihemoprotein reductase
LQLTLFPTNRYFTQQNVSFGVFGLGNRQYEHFCAVGKHIQKAMKELGANPVVRIGTGDDDDDIEEDFEAWSADLFTALEASPLLKAGSGAAATPDSVPAYLVEAVKDAPISAIDVLNDGNGLTTSSPHLATITLVKELHTSLSDRSCIHVEVDISNCSATYEAGDHVGVFAENSPEVVTAAAKILGLPLDMCFTLRTPTTGPSSSTSLSAPPGAAGTALTLRHALAHYADVLSSPDKGALSALAAFATNPQEAAKLNQLASIEGRDIYHSYIVTAKRSLLEIMQEFPSAKPTLGAFFGSIAPRLQPRYYSISSSPIVHPRSVHITAAVIKETMPTGRVHHGVATSWLAAAKTGTKVPVFLRHSAFKLPKDNLTPVVMVGPGTGLAPFRGFIQERAAAVSSRNRKNDSINTKLGPGVMFFGCRREDQDYIYKEELESAVANGALSELNVAFSRRAAVKDYVQHHLKRQGQAVWDLLGPKGNGYLYVCGDAKNMAKDVHAALIEVATEAAGGNSTAGEAAVKVLLDSGRYQKDVW